MSELFPRDTRDIRLLSPRSWPTRHRVHAVVLVALVAVHIGCQLVLAKWYIEDAAISFAYARNWASGEGLVGVAGGERIEGYSNPTWVALLALGNLLWIDPFQLSKILALALGSLCIPLTWGITRHARSGPDGRLDEVPLVAALFLAIYPQFVIWNASGLENSLFSFLLALGVWTSLREVRDQRPWPWSAVVWMLLAISRPEGIIYAAWAGAWTLFIAARHDVRWGLSNAARWLVTFWLPFLAYQGARYTYFAWEFPNTYYGKQDHRVFQPYNWSSRGWNQSKDWAFRSWTGAFLPLFVLAMTGLRRYRVLAVTVILAALGAALLLWPGPELLRKSALVDWLGTLDFWPLLDQPRHWRKHRVWLLIAVAIAAAAAAVLGRREGWRALVYCWGLATISLFFQVYSDGDWMKSFRWFSLLSVPIAVLFAVGIGVVGDAVQRTWDYLIDRALFLPIDGPIRGLGPFGTMTMVTLSLLCIPPAVKEIQVFERRPETGPFSVKKRVNYYNFVLNRLHFDGRPKTLDVDMGANLYWGRWDQLDMAGLIDVPFAQHRYQSDFVVEYLFEEERPHIAHLHGGWERTTRFTSYDEWEDMYIEVAGYPTSRKRLHIGNHLRRDLVLQSKWPGTDDRSVRLRDGITLEGWSTPVTQIGPNRYLYLEVGLHSRLRDEDEGLQLLVFLSNADGELHTWQVTPGYTWVEPSEWRVDEVFVGKYSLLIPKDFPQGTYDLGFALLLADGRLVGAPMTDDELPMLPAGVQSEPPRLARGELRWPDAVEIIDRRVQEDHIKAFEAKSGELADSGDCDGAVEQWRLAWASTTRRFVWQGNIRKRLAPRIARCFAARSEANPPAERIDDLVTAHDWDWHEPTYLSVADATADALVEAGHAARDAEDWDEAYRNYRDAVAVKPTHAWARRWAEKVRAKRIEAMKAAR